MKETVSRFKLVILVGGPSKGTRFRPLSFDVPKPLFPIGGHPLLYHHLKAVAGLPGLMEVVVIGFYPKSDFDRFLWKSHHDLKIRVNYLQEFKPLGTGGCLYHFRDQLAIGNPDVLLVMNSDVSCDFPTVQLVDFHRGVASVQAALSTPHDKYKGNVVTAMVTEATKSQAKNFGVIVENKQRHNEVLHFVEKPETYVSSTISCGIYAISIGMLEEIGEIAKQQKSAFTVHSSFDEEHDDMFSLEREVFPFLAGTGRFYAFHFTGYWSHIKTPASAIYANRHILALERRKRQQTGDNAEQKANGQPVIFADVYIDPTAVVHPTAVLGPNVSIGKDVVIEAGVRVRESIILDGAIIQKHSCILHTILGWSSTVGQWTRLEGTPTDPNPDKPFAKLEMLDLFTDDGRLNPTVTIIGRAVSIPSEVVVLNSIVLPNKDISGSRKNQIIL